MNDNLFKKLHVSPIIGSILLIMIFLPACATDSKKETNSTKISPGVLINEETPAKPSLQTPTERLLQKSTATIDVSSSSETDGDGINHQLMFAIRNLGQFSGENGQPPWFAWGSDSFAVAPDGNFWIADTAADPDRLLLYSPEGDLIGLVSLQIGNRQYWARDLFVESSGLWVLDYISQPEILLHLDFNGELFASYLIPAVFAAHQQEETTMPGLWDIVYANDHQVLLDGPVGSVELSIQGNQLTFKHSDRLPFQGHEYIEDQKGFTLDGLFVPIESQQPEHFISHFNLVGISRENSIYIHAIENNIDQGKTEPSDLFVRRYSLSGDQTGVAFLPLPEVLQQPAIALGPDGCIYAMYSFTDHSVEVYRLLFFTGKAPLHSPLTQSSKKYFSPLFPSKLPATSDSDGAREAILTFFADLAAQKFGEAADLYGGSYADAIALNVVALSDSPAVAWQNICDSMFCLPVSDILDSRQLNQNTYEFLVGFVHQNGFRYAYGPCCGYFQPVPASSWFVYSVVVQKIDGQWNVMAGPEPLP